MPALYPSWSWGITYSSSMVHTAVMGLPPTRSRAPESTPKNRERRTFFVSIASTKVRMTGKTDVKFINPTSKLFIICTLLFRALVRVPAVIHFLLDPGFRPGAGVLSLFNHIMQAKSIIIQRFSGIPRCFICRNTGYFQMECYKLFIRPTVFFHLSGRMFRKHLSIGMYFVHIDARSMYPCREAFPEAGCRFSPASVFVCIHPV